MTPHQEYLAAIGRQVLNLAEEGDDYEEDDTADPMAELGRRARKRSWTQEQLTQQATIALNRFYADRDRASGQHNLTAAIR